MTNILIGGAWPYANGPLHIGHIAALLPGDVLARYYRQKGDYVFYVSGSDCFGTPITVRARQERKTPLEISEQYHKEFCEVFLKLGFSYDLYTKTSDARHIAFVQAFHKKLYESDYISERTVGQAYCPHCEKALTERLVVGRCPFCGAKARGDQCDACGAVLDAEQLKDGVCADCGTAVVLGQSTQLFLKISKLEPELREFLNTRTHWRKNATAFTKRYIDEGLRDRAITRDLDWGISVPKEGYENKKIYIWAENVLGYLSASAVLCAERGIPFSELFGENARHYYVHGKDNIPFHTIILPSLLLAHGEGYRLPDDIISSEHLTLEGRKISTSQNWAVWAKDIVNEVHPDALRYFFIANGPEKRDTDFSRRELALKNNGELLGVWGNFVNRTLAFIVKYQDGIVPEGTLSFDCEVHIKKAFETVGKHIEAGEFKESLEAALDLARFGNRLFDAGEPWKTRIAAPKLCGETIYNCVQIIAGAAVLFKPFLPFSSDTVCGWLGLSERLIPQTVLSGTPLPAISTLFERLSGG